MIGSESARHLVESGYRVIGLDNDMRASFFGDTASTNPVSERLADAFPDEFEWLKLDIRDREGIERLFARHAADIEIVVHTAAQPSHDWAAQDPHTDFSVNANGTLNLLEASRRSTPDATFIFLSTNKVYGDTPNHLPLVELETRLELPEDHPYFGGIDTSMSIDHCMHSLFGVSKAAADLAGAGVRALLRHADGLLPRRLPDRARTTPARSCTASSSYLMRCTVTGEPYTIFGYDGKQVRDNIHSADLVRAFTEFHASPESAAVYNLGGGRQSNCSMLEAIEMCERIAGRKLDYTLSDQARMGDHRWWIGDLSGFKARYPAWDLEYDVEAVLREIYDANVETWGAVA